MRSRINSYISTSENSLEEGSKARLFFMLLLEKTPPPPNNNLDEDTGSLPSSALSFLLFKWHTAKTKCQKFETNTPSPNFHIRVSVSELYIPTMGLPVLLEEICRLILGINKSLIDT
jgi:hypothetical protein